MSTLCCMYSKNIHVYSLHRWFLIAVSSAGRWEREEEIQASMDPMIIESRYQKGMKEIHFCGLAFCYFGNVFNLAYPNDIKCQSSITDKIPLEVFLSPQIHTRLYFFQRTKQKMTLQLTDMFTVTKKKAYKNLAKKVVCLDIY